MKRLASFLIMTLLSSAIIAQGKFYTKTGKVSFYSKASLEDIEAHNRSVTCVLDTKNGNFQFLVQIRGFQFEKALMQEHFNENYMDSDKFPRAEFKGQVVNNGDINYAQDGVYPAVVKGKLTIHGQTKDVAANGKLTIKGGKILVASDFILVLADYKIRNEKMNNISDKIRIAVECLLEPLKTS